MDTPEALRNGAAPTANARIGLTGSCALECQTLQEPPAWPGLARLHAQATGVNGRTMLNATASQSNGAAPAATARISMTQRRALERLTLRL